MLRSSIFSSNHIRMTILIHIKPTNPLSKSRKNDSFWNTSLRIISKSKKKSSFWNVSLMFFRIFAAETTLICHERNHRTGRRNQTSGKIRPIGESGIHSPLWSPPRRQDLPDKYHLRRPIHLFNDGCAGRQQGRTNPRFHRCDGLVRQQAEEKAEGLV